MKYKCCGKNRLSQYQLTMLLVLTKSVIIATFIFLFGKYIMYMLFLTIILSGKHYSNLTYFLQYITKVRKLQIKKYISERKLFFIYVFMYLFIS